MKEQTSIRLIRLAHSRPAKVLLQKTSAMIGHVPQALRNIVAESGAHGTCDGAKDVFLPEVAGGLDIPGAAMERNVRSPVASQTPLLSTGAYPGTGRKG